MIKKYDKKAEQTLEKVCSGITINNIIPSDDYARFDVKRGLRNSDGTGVMAGLSRVCSVEGYYINDGERVPKDGRLFYRGINMADIAENCLKENRFGYEEASWLLCVGELPNENELCDYRTLLAERRTLPDDFIEDTIMKSPSKDIMNKTAMSVLALYSYDENPDDLSINNIVKQSIDLIAQIPSIMAYAYQVKRRAFDKKSMYIHQNDKSLSTAESILRTLRPDKKFTTDEARLLDLCMIVHADHGGGNNSAFTTRCVSSTGTDTYSAIASAISSLKGPRHGGAALKAHKMLCDIKENCTNPLDEGILYEYLEKILNKNAGDKSGLIYGMGHAVYTLSDPRAVLLKNLAEKKSKIYKKTEDFKILSAIEHLTPELFQKIKGVRKNICANVDLYSGLIYDCLDIPEELYTPMFMASRISGWCAHRIEEICSGSKIIRPAYKSVSLNRDYIKLSARTGELKAPEYIPIEERYAKKEKKYE